MAAPPDKKQVCSALTGALKASPLASVIDPTAFFMQLMTNYAALTQGGVLDLVSLYEPLAQKYPAAPLADLFRGLTETGERLGFEVRGPDLSRDTDPPEPMAIPARRETPQRSSLSPQRSSLTPTPRAASPGGAPNLSPTETGLISNLIGCMKSTDAGPLLSSPQLTYFLATHLGEMFDGQRIDLTPFHEALMGIAGVEERHIYVGVVRFRRWIGRSGITVIEPPWQLDPRLREELEEVAKKSGTEQAARGPVSLPPLDVPKDAGPAPGETRQEARLRKFGFANKNTGRIVGLVFGVILVAAALGLRIALDPMSGMEAAAYTAVFPAKETFLYEGKWMATLDTARWSTMTLEQREKSLRDLTQILKSENRLTGARILSDTDRSVIGFELPDKGITISDSVLKANLPKP